MNDINTFANEKLLDFTDAVHVEISQLLEEQYGNEWLDLGVRRHCNPTQLARVEKMLHSPMRVVEMDRRDDEIYGVEHLWSIIGGNWSLFKVVFDNRTRTEACLEEIKELRHNLAHRRKRHYLLRPNLIRVLGSFVKLSWPRSDLPSLIVVRRRGRLVEFRPDTVGRR